jgi:DNA-binding beta-propeller fold protein YncE
MAVRMPLLSTSFMFRMNAVKQRPSLTCSRTKSSRLCISKAKQGCPQYDPIARKVYVNLQDQNIFAVIDPQTDEVVARYSVAKCEGNHGMALDPEHRRAFLACEGNELMTVFDLEKHQPIAFLPLARGPDVVKYDSSLKRVYVACYSGAISVFQEDDANHFRKLEDFPVQKKVHSLAVDNDTHCVYAPEQEVDGQPAARITVYEAAAGQAATLR